MFNSNVKIELDLGPEAAATSAQTLQGKVILNAPTPLSLRDVSVRLLGRCRTCASVKEDGEAETGKIETETFLKIDQKIFPSKELKQKEVTIQAGYNSFPFTLVIPEHSSGGDSSRWLGRVLPPSVVFPYRQGRVEYDLEARIHRPGFLGFTKKGGIIVPFKASIPAYSQLPLVYAQRSLEVGIYETRLGWAATLWEAIGYDQNSRIQTYRARMETPAQGIVLGIHHDLKDIIRRLSIEPLGEECPPETQILIESVVVKIITICRTSALSVSEEKKGRTILLQADKVNFRVPSNNDISALVADAAIPSELPPTLDAPLAHISHELHVILGVRPELGPTTKTTYVELVNTVPIISGAIKSDEPPAYSDVIEDTVSSIGQSGPACSAATDSKRTEEKEKPR